MPDRGQTEPPPSDATEAEDFVFHLARGSELLKQDRVHDAKQEIERALSHQPSDPKGQDLLGVVYFRLGLYPRAIVIYEALVRAHPEALEPRVNLALCYLKTGQAPEARAELERVVEHNPRHTRAWGYLGLAYQRLGDPERAAHAFESGGYTQMARRIAEVQAPRRTDSLRPGDARFSITDLAAPEPRRSAPPEADEELGRAARSAYAALEADGEGFRADPGQRGSAPPSRRPSGTWTATEPGRPTSPVGSAPSTRVPALPKPPADLVAAEPRARGPEAAEAMLRERLVVFPREGTIALDSQGNALVQSEGAFIARLDRVVSLAFAGGLPGLSTIVPRARGRELPEAIGSTSPLYELEGRGALIFAPRQGCRLRVVELSPSSPLYLRESVLVGLEPQVAYEHGRLPLGEGESVLLLLLRGPGVAILELPDGARAVELAPSRPLTVRGSAVLGWCGRAIPRALGLAEAAHFPERGMTTLSGEGLVLLESLL